MPSRQEADSPRASQSPAPSGIQGDLELDLLGVANALYNLGTTVINDSTKERDQPGENKQVGMRVYVFSLFFFPTLHKPLSLVPSSNEVVRYLATIDETASHISTMIPLQVLAYIDNSQNPMQLTKDRIERAAAENQFMNGKIAALDVRPLS